MTVQLLKYSFGHRQTVGLMCLVLLILPTFALGSDVQKRSLIRDGPPRRPNHFSSVDELNKYLTALTDYYTVLGRPRFGKRDGALPAYNAERMSDERDPSLSLAFVESLLSRGQKSRR